MKISVDVSGIKALRAKLSSFSDRRFDAALATGLTRTAVEVRDAVREAMPTAFDRPTPYTMRSLYIVTAAGSQATAGRSKMGWSRYLSAEVGFKDDLAGSGTPATKYLLPNVEGGVRSVKRFERALQMAGHLAPGYVTAPGPFAKRDAYGNVSKGQIIQILSQLRVTITAGSTRNMALPSKGNERKVIGAIKRAGGRYFVIPVGDKSGKKAGIYLRDIGSRHAMLVFAFIRPPTYRKRLDFDGITARVSSARLMPNVRRAIDEHIARMGLRGGR